MSDIKKCAFKNKKPFGGKSEGFSLTVENFFAKLCNKIGTSAYKQQ